METENTKIKTKLPFLLFLDLWNKYLGLKKREVSWFLSSPPSQNLDPSNDSKTKCQVGNFLTMQRGILWDSESPAILLNSCLEMGRGSSGTMVLCQWGYCPHSPTRRRSHYSQVCTGACGYTVRKRHSHYWRTHSYELNFMYGFSGNGHGIVEQKLGCFYERH